MQKDTHLINIYLKIHNKQTLTLDDLRYLAQYAPECFEKTCKNVVYNFPASKPVMEPSSDVTKAPLSSDFPQAAFADASSLAESAREASLSPTLQNVVQILNNLKRLEAKEFPVANVEAAEVKDLLGNLYMELLFPHNDTDTFFNAPLQEDLPTFDFRA